MYSDTHFHFQNLLTHRDATGFLVNGTQILEKMAHRDCRFALDIGTSSTDLFSRQMCLDNAIAGIRDYNTANKVRKFVYFSAGVWPSLDELKNVRESVKTLKEQIAIADASRDFDTLNRKVIAIGECGIDHHYSLDSADARSAEDFTQEVLENERALFIAQLRLAKLHNLPVIVHSREAFADTIACIKEVGYNRGIIHCFSYGLDEAAAFLDLGWYISFSGAVTYAKGSRATDIAETIKYVPHDRILCETDSPYLAPVPYRGKSNTPLLVEYVYDFVADILRMDYKDFSNLVDDNIQALFELPLSLKHF